MFVRVSSRDDDLAVARELYFVRTPRIVCKPDCPLFSRNRRKDLNLHLRLDVTVPPPENRAVRVECHVIPFGLDAHRLVTGRPNSAGCDIVHITPMAVIIECRIAAPPIDYDVAVSRFTAAGARYNSCKWNVAEYGDSRLRGMGCVDVTC